MLNGVCFKRSKDIWPNGLRPAIRFRISKDKIPKIYHKLFQINQIGPPLRSQIAPNLLHHQRHLFTNQSAVSHLSVPSPITLCHKPLHHRHLYPYSTPPIPTGHIYLNLQGEPFTKTLFDISLSSHVRLHARYAYKLLSQMGSYPEILFWNRFMYHGGSNPKSNLFKKKEGVCYDHDELYAGVVVVVASNLSGVVEAENWS